MFRIELRKENEIVNCLYSNSLFGRNIASTLMRSFEQYPEIDTIDIINLHAHFSKDSLINYIKEEYGDIYDKNKNL